MQDDFDSLRPGRIVRARSRHCLLSWLRKRRLSVGVLATQLIVDRKQAAPAEHAIVGGFNDEMWQADVRVENILEDSEIITAEPQRDCKFARAKRQFRY